MYLFAFIVSVLGTLFIVRSANLHGGRSGDHDFSQPQKFHAVAVPRVGGLGIVLGLLAALAGAAVLGRKDEASFLAMLLACATPAFGAGFVQDLTEAIAPRGRLLATGISAILAFVYLDAGIRSVGIAGIDWIVGFTIGSAIFTTLAVAGIANAVNIIDGFNGLASMCAMLMLGAISHIAFQVGDYTIMQLGLAGVAAVLGFFVWNYPGGRIFLGDGGAYFLGFYISELSILLVDRNPTISPMLPLLVCAYPVLETLFSIYRRLLLKNKPPQIADGIHLHSLIYRRHIRWAGHERDAKSVTRRNSMTSPILWTLCLCAVMPAVLFWHRPILLATSIIVFCSLYVWLYWRIVRFKTPLVLRRLLKSTKSGRWEPKPSPGGE